MILVFGVVLYIIAEILFMQFSSAYVENAVAAFAKLPGIGKKTALRLVLHALKQDEDWVKEFTTAIEQLKTKVQFCQKCHNISDAVLCSICTNSSRKQQLICVVENIKDVIAIESTQQFNGIYHVLGGLISPLDGVGPDALNIDSLVERVKLEEPEELIFALNATILGDTTIYYIQKKLENTTCKITTIARGVSFGGELEYADELTLAKSLTNRLPVNQYIH